MKYEEIFKFIQEFEGNADVILPFANKNKEQETLGKKIGFQFKAKEKQEILNMIEEIFINCKMTYCEQYSHIVMAVEKIRIKFTSSVASSHTQEA